MGAVSRLASGTSLVVAAGFTLLAPGVHAAPTSGQAAKEAKEATEAKACLHELAEGRKLPAAPVDDSDLGVLLRSGGGGSRAEQDALAQCLPRSTWFRLSVGRGTAGVLSRCFGRAAVALDKAAKNPELLPVAQFGRDSCVSLAYRLGSQQGQMAVLYSSEDKLAGAGVMMGPVGLPSTFNLGAHDVLDRAMEAGPSLEKCTQAHGPGTVYAAIRSGAGQQRVHAFAENESEERPSAALRTCVRAALSKVRPRDDEAWWAVIAVRLTTPARALPEKSSKLAGPLEPYKDPYALGGLGGGRLSGGGLFGPAAPREAREKKLGGEVKLQIRVEPNGLAFAVKALTRPKQLGPAFERSCRNHVQTLRFERPKTKTGQPVAVLATHTCVFDPATYVEFKPRKRRP